MKKRLITTSLIILLPATCLWAGEVKENYEKLCAKCHGAEGKGDTKMGQKLNIKDLTDGKLQAELKDETMFKAVKEGVKDGDKIRMKPAEGLTDPEIKELVAFVRKFKK